MDRVIGGALGLCAGIAVVALGVTKGVGVRDCLWRAAVAVFFGYWIGRLIFGPVGLSMVKEAASAAAAGATPPETPTGGRAPAPDAPAAPETKKE